MNPPDAALRHRGKIPEISFTCKVLLFNSSFAYVRVQSTFANNIQDWGITETKEIDAQKYATFSQEFAIPFIVGFDHTQRVRLTLFGGDTLKVGHGFPLGYVELSLMEIAAQPKDVPILIQGEATVGYLRIRSCINRIRQDFELTSSDPIVSLGFAESAPTLEKLRAKKSSFLDIRTSYTVEFHCSQLFRSNPTDNKPMPTTLMGTKTKVEIIQQFLSLVKVKKLQYSVQLFVTTDPVPDEFFFVDDLDIDDLESWRMVYSTRKLDFFRPTLHDQSTEISEEVLMGEQGLHNHPNLNMAFVVLLHYVTAAGQEGVHTLAATVKHMTDHVTAIQEFMKQEQERKTQPSTATPAPTRPDCQISFQRTRSISRYMDSTASPSLKSGVSGSRFKSRSQLLSRGLSQLLSTDKATKAKGASAEKTTSRSKDASTDSGGGGGGAAAAGEASSAHDEPDSASLDEFTQTLVDFTTVIRTTMVLPLTFTMLPRVDQQVVVTGPKYEEKLQALFQECHQDWQQRMKLPFLFSVHMFQSASDSATVMLQRLNDGCLLTPVVLVDMFHPCLQQTLLQRARRKNKKPMPHCETSRQSCNVLHALLTFYEGLSPFFPAGAITAIAGGNVRIPAVIPTDSAPRRASLSQRSADRDGVDAAFGWLTHWFGGGSVASTSGVDGSVVKATKAVRYVRRHGFPYVEEVLLARPPPPAPPRGHKKRRGHDDGLQWLQAATCFAPPAAPSRDTGSAAHESTATARCDTWTARNVAAWKRAVESAFGDYDALRVTYNDARDVIRGFMEAAEAFQPVTDAYVYAQGRLGATSGGLDGGAAASSTAATPSALVDGRYRRRRLALYTGTEYDIDLSDEDVRSLLPAPCHVPTLGKNHDFTLLRALLQPPATGSAAATHNSGASTPPPLSSSGGTSPVATGHEHRSGAAWTVTPVVWILGRSPPLRVKVDEDDGGTGLGRHHSHGKSFHSFTLNTNLHERLQRLSAAFPVHCRDKCLVIVLAAEHRYDFPVVGRDGHSIDELRAIAHPFDDFHKELGEMLKQRRAQAQQWAQKVAAEGSPPAGAATAAAVAVDVPDNVFLIHHYAFSEVLARALEYEMLLDPQAFQHRRGSHHPRHHHHHRDEAGGGGGGGGGGHRGSVRGSSGGEGASHVVIHRLPKLSSLRAILSLIFCSNYHHRSGSPRHGTTPRHGSTPRGGLGATSTVDEHVIDQILGTGEEIIDRHVRDVNRAEELQRKPAHDKSRSDALEVMRNMSKRASTIASKLGLVDKRKRQRPGGDEESAADRLKRDVIRDFRHLNEVKRRFDAAIAEYVRRQYQHIVATALLDVEAARAAAQAAAVAKAKSKAEAAAKAAAAAAATTRSMAVSMLLQPSASSDSAPVQPAATVEAPAASVPTAMGMERVFSDEDDEDDDGPVLSLPMPLAAKSLSERGLLGKWRESFYHRSPRAGDSAANANGAPEAKDGLLETAPPAPATGLTGLRPSPLRLQVDSDDDEDYDGASAQRPSHPTAAAEDDDGEDVLMPNRPTLFPSQKLFNPLRRVPTAK